MNNYYDIIIIGAGPTGEGVANIASKYNKKILVIEKYFQVGGGCVHWGTIPSKTIREVLLHFNNLSQINYIGRDFYHLFPSFSSILKTVEVVIANQVKMRQKFYDNNLITVKQGIASFINNNTIEVSNSNLHLERFEGKDIVIATGSRPYRPEEIDFNNPRILDSDKLLELKEKPRSLTIYGAGVIGVEYACIFSAMGVKVNLINTRERVLDFLDYQITDALNYHMTDLGITIRNNETLATIEEDEGIILNLQSGKRIKSDYLLWAQGRSGNTQELHLEKVNIEVNSRNQIEVNEYYQTIVDNIYAGGDVVGWPSLAGAAFDQGRYIGSLICGEKITDEILKDIPTGIYTFPEISCIGKTEKELTDQKIAYEVGFANFKELAKIQIIGQNVGFLKLLFHRETLEILGIHCFGRQASEIIHIGQVLMKQPKEHNNINYFINTTFNYPTMAEAYRVAALDGISRLN